MLERKKAQEKHNKKFEIKQDPPIFLHIVMMIPQDLLNKKRPKKNHLIHEYLYIEEFVPENEPEDKKEESKEERGIIIIEL